MIFEVQFHTQASLEAKELTHKAYERDCAALRRTKSARSSKVFSARVNSMIPIPPDAADIEDYPRKERDG